MTPEIYWFEFERRGIHLRGAVAGVSSRGLALSTTTASAVPTAAMYTIRGLKANARSSQSRSAALVRDRVSDKEPILC